MRRTALVLALVVSAALLPAEVAQAGQGCAPSGGAQVPRAQPASGEFVFSGHGFGHGVGMSQYGAQGAARLGCDARTILQTYFPGATVAQAPMPPNAVVGLAQPVRTTGVEAVGGAVGWQLCVPGGACEAVPVTQGRGARWTVTVGPDASYQISEGGRVLWTGGDKERILRATLSQADDDDRVVRITPTGVRYKWGTLQFDSVETAPPTMAVALDIPSVERYLRGIREVPETWPTEALRAQAIAARSYASARIAQPGRLLSPCRCHLHVTMRDQVYRGYDQELADAPAGNGWVEAVDATAGQTLRYRGRPVQAFYSNSHGGHSESGRFVFGGNTPYLQPVDDSRWDLASDSPYRSWSVGVGADQLGAAAGVGRATRIELSDPRGAAGRVGDPARGFGGVRVEGTTGTATLSGESLKSALGLRSTLFAVQAREQPTTKVPPAYPDRGGEPPVRATEPPWRPAPGPPPG
ncbi:MAG: SpoIID/LytB domain-containing protein [Egibacteraceae bacterium]